MAKHIHIFGDSHTIYYDISEIRFSFRRLLLNKKNYNWVAHTMKGASMLGFRDGQSTLNMKEIIKDHLETSSHMLFSFGQVDVEIGFYYRKVVKGLDTLTQDEFAETIIGHYERFISELSFPREQIAIKGINVPVMKEMSFTHAYISRQIFNAKSVTDETPKHRLLLSEYLATHEAQTRIHLVFNQKLKDMSERLGVSYFDINTHLLDPHSTPEAPFIDERFIPIDRDHHLIDSLFVRKLHIYKTIEALGLNPETYLTEDGIKEYTALHIK